MGFHQVNEVDDASVINAAIGCDHDLRVCAVLGGKTQLTVQFRLACALAVNRELTVFCHHQVECLRHHLTAICGARQLDLDRLRANKVTRHHEDHEQHQHDIDERRDVDAGRHFVRI